MIAVDGQDLIVVLDDDPSVVRALGRILKLRGFNVELFSEVDKFLGSANLTSSVCLVLDVHLGAASGIDLKRELAHSHQLPPIIFITADDSDETRRMALDAGCVACLTKPFSINALIDVIRTAGGSAKYERFWTTDCPDR